jgi:hypothetical protein
MAWTDDRISELRRRSASGESKRQILREMNLTPGQLAGAMIHHNIHRPIEPGSVVPLPADHPAVTSGRTAFPLAVVDPLREIRTSASLTVLKTGRDNRKLGAKVTKGAWAGFSIYSLTLEERATCPTTCQHWRTCMGNAMQMAARNRHGPDLERQIELELRVLSVRHSAPGDGFVVRLHVLGDFYSVEYVELWRRWLRRFPKLRVWGYTAWPSDTPIGAAVRRLSQQHWDRFAIRLSSRRAGRDRAITVVDPKAARGAILCPVETGKTRSCGTCGLCWAPAARDRTIAFVLHGKTSRRSGYERSADR